MPRTLQPSQPPEGLVEKTQAASTSGVSLSLVEAVKFTVRQAAKTAGISESQMRAEILKGKVPVIRICSKMLVLERDLENYLRGHYGIVQSFEVSDAIPSRMTSEISESPLINPRRKSA